MNILDLIVWFGERFEQICSEIQVDIKEVDSFTWRFNFEAEAKRMFKYFDQIIME